MNQYLLRSLYFAVLSVALSGCYDTGYYGGPRGGHGYPYGNQARYHGNQGQYQGSHGGGRFGYNGGPRFGQPRVSKQSLNQARQKKKQWRRKARKRH